MDDIKTVSGIDSLYYFCESNHKYDDLFLEILDQIEDKKGVFLKREIEFKNSDIYIIIDETPLFFLGRAEGFYWFNDLNGYFKIAFKDKKQNRGLHDIRVQLLATGIYTLGIKSLLEFINTKLLEDYTTGNFPITRADLNCFVQYDFSYITKDMFVTRKRKYSTVSEIGTSTATQTLYIGSNPFLLRIYNKQEELKKSPKKDLMYEYFSNNGLDTEKPIFNIEFEMHRTHLKQFNINTIDELLVNAKELFSSSMDDIRLIDLDSISSNDKKHNKYKAKTPEIWKHIKESYTIIDFYQSSIPLERIKRKLSLYDDTKFKSQIIAVLRRAFINNLDIDLEYMDALYFEAKNSLKKSTNQDSEKTYEDIHYLHIDGTREHLRKLEDGEIIKPVKTVNISSLGDYDLTIYLHKLSKNKELSTKDYNIWKVARKEALKRGLINE